MILINCQVGKEYIIEKIIGGLRVTRRLNHLGVLPNVTVKIVLKNVFGPMIIDVKGTRLALGRGLVAKIKVKEK